MIETISDPKTSISDLTGLAPEQIGAQHLQTDLLKQQGLLINLDVTGSSMFICGTDWGELGVDVDSTTAQRMTPGRKYLYQKAEVNRLNSVVSAMRQCLERYTYDLAGFRPARYMHYKVYPVWRKEWESLLERFNEVKRDLADMHDQAVDALAEEFNQIAREAWLAATGAGAEFVVFNRVAYDDLDDFTGAVVTRALAKMPTVDDIETKLQADYRVSLLYGLEEIARAEAAAARIRQQAEMELAKAKSAEFTAYLEEAAAQERYNHEQRMNRMTEQERELQIEAMMHAEAEHAREQLKTIANPLQEVVDQLRRQLAQDATEMLSSIQKNGYIRGKVAERGRGLLEIFDLLSIQDDIELRTRLVQLKNAIGPVGEARPVDTPERDTQEVVKTLESITDLAHAAAVDLASGPSRFAFVE